jgi:hypothetical protein
VIFSDGGAAIAVLARDGAPGGERMASRPQFCFPGACIVQFVGADRDRGRVLAMRGPEGIMLKKSLASMCAAAGLLLALVSPAHADPLLVRFDIIVGSTHGDMVPIFGVPVHAGDVIDSTLTYDRDAIGSSPDWKPILAQFAGCTEAAGRAILCNREVA